VLRDHQRAAVLAIAVGLPDEKRRTFLERVDARLSLRGARITPAFVVRFRAGSNDGYRRVVACRPNEPAARIMGMRCRANGVRHRLHYCAFPDRRSRGRGISVHSPGVGARP
jgi:hypothetical protein